MATDIIARGMITEYIAGTNINFTENRDGTVEISASGSISSEDSVARDAIGNHKSDTSNPHNVTPAQIGLGNVDNTSDLDKPISTAVKQAIDNKADKTVATTSTDGLMSAEDKGKLDAFEITTDGGKLHDKDIATTDLIPSSMPADGGNADYANNLSDWAGIELTNANDAPLGISRIHGENFSDGGNAPFDFWTTILTLGPNERNDYRQQFAFPWSARESAFFPKYRVLDSGTWGEWIQIYTSANKPYVTGSATVEANSNVCVSNHGFTPSAVIWWDGSLSGVAVSFSDTQFVMDKTSSVDRMVNYLIFK